MRGYYHLLCDSMPFFFFFALLQYPGMSIDCFYPVWVNMCWFRFNGRMSYISKHSEQVMFSSRSYCFVITGLSDVLCNMRFLHGFEHKLYLRVACVLEKLPQMPHLRGCQPVSFGSLHWHDISSMFLPSSQYTSLFLRFLSYSGLIFLRVTLSTHDLPACIILIVV